MRDNQESLKILENASGLRNVFLSVGMDTLTVGTRSLVPIDLGLFPLCIT